MDAEEREQSIRIPKMTPTLGVIEEGAGREENPTSLQTVSDFDEDEENEGPSSAAKPAPPTAAHAGPSALPARQMSESFGLANRAPSWTARPRSQIALQRPPSANMQHQHPGRPSGNGAPAMGMQQAGSRHQSFTARKEEPVETIG